MPISTQNLLQSNLYYFHSPSHILPNSLKPPLKFPQKITNSSKLKIESCPSRQLLQMRVYNSNGSLQGQDGFESKFNFDYFLSVAEVVCLIPSAIISIGCIVNWTSTQKLVQLNSNNKILVWQIGLLVFAVFIGGVIRRRQWGRINRGGGVSLNSWQGLGLSKLDLVGRIEKLEEDLRSSTTIIRMLSRQLEKLGIRFRVTRKSLKEPISEAAALALKNSEATQALQMQENILEKELGEMQKVLLAMQEQQHKQLELILAIGKAGKLRESKKESVVEGTTQPLNSVAGSKEGKQMEGQPKTGVRQRIVSSESA
ncbi:hypothetical protein IFM89_003737 [Coptis chinensis]|uniref:Uncharacterized protein n=1 Tax=Coptis chinensis TaxID=261450 RepID=A0A835I0U7_9MAGN|nr:hypothetical protein IFM89_003737 [Coptis chinensis]